MTKARKTLISTLAALTVGTTMLAASAPAQARHRHYHHGGVVAAGVIGGLALAGAAAAAAASAPVYVAPVYYGTTCYIQRQPVYNGFGHLVYYRSVRVCH